MKLKIPNPFRKKSGHPSEGEGEQQQSRGFFANMIYCLGALIITTACVATGIRLASEPYTSLSSYKQTPDGYVTQQLETSQPYLLATQTPYSRPTEPGSSSIVVTLPDGTSCLPYRLEKGQYPYGFYRGEGEGPVSWEEYMRAFEACVNACARQYPGFAPVWDANKGVLYPGNTCLPDSNGDGKVNFVPPRN